MTNEEIEKAQADLDKLPKEVRMRGLDIIVLAGISALFEIARRLPEPKSTEPTRYDW